jgi:hypothetical protein
MVIDAMSGGQYGSCRDWDVNGFNYSIYCYDLEGRIREAQAREEARLKAEREAQKQKQGQGKRRGVKSNKMKKRNKWSVW